MEYIVRYSIKPKKAGEFRQWLLDNHAKLEAAVPEGWKYLGTYFVVRGFGSYTSESRWALTNYGALDHSTEAQDQLTRDIFEFIHDAHPMTGTLLKSATDVRTLQ